MDELTRIRGRIDHLDKDLLQLLKSRYELAHQLGRIKRDRGILIKDANRERKILSEADRIAETERLPREQVRLIFRQVFDIAVEAQRSGNPPTTRQRLDVLIMGGTGGMGKLFARLLANQGCLVRIFGRSLARSRRTANDLAVLPGGYGDIARADIVMISVPISATAKVAIDAGAMMKPRSLLVDLSSVKTGIADAIARKTAPLEYVSLHPLFGPDLDHIRGQRILAVPYRTRRVWPRLQRILGHEGSHITITTAHAHDVMMAKIQALNHFAMMSLAASMGKTREEFDTRFWRLTKEQFRRIRRNWETVLQIQGLNPYAAQERTRFKRVVDEITGMNRIDVVRISKALDTYNSGHASNK